MYARPDVRYGVKVTDASGRLVGTYAAVGPATFALPRTAASRSVYTVAVYEGETKRALAPILCK